MDWLFLLVIILYTSSICNGIYLDINPGIERVSVIVIVFINQVQVD